jgi:hypothetical protein
MRPGATGLTLAAPVWRQFMIEAHDVLKERGADMTRPYPDINLATAKINRLSGNLASDSTPPTLVKEEVFADYGMPIDLDKTREYTSRLGNRSDKFVLELHSQKPDLPNWEEPVQEWLRLHPKYLSSNGAVRASSDDDTDSLIDFLSRDQRGDLSSSINRNQVVRPGMTAPKIAFLSPRDGGTIAPGRLDVSFAVISSQWDIEKVELFFDDQLITTDSIAPWKKSITIPESIRQGSTHILNAVATDSTGNAGVAKIEVTVQPDTTGPEIVFLGPVPQQRIPILSRVDALVSVQDFQSNVRVVEFLLDDVSLTTLQSPPYSYTIWTGENIGQHTLVVKAWDANNNMSERSIPLYFERERILAPRAPEITNVKNYRQALSVDITVPTPENIEWIELKVFLNEENIKTERIDTPLKFSQLQILKPESGDGKLELWSKTKGEESKITSQKIVKF